jgi:lysophospholipase L1-like esterase
MPYLRALLFILAVGSTQVVADQPNELLHDAKRIVFLGDSITFSGLYVACFDAWLQTRDTDSKPVVINVGLPSETVSGLSEDGHAGGRFPRPDLAERLERVLKVTRPDFVIACYGINCGIYQPFDEQRFQRYQEGIRHLKAKVEAAGAKLLIVTPPFYDDQRSRIDFSYDAVLQRYSNWLLDQRQKGWLVADLHDPMAREVARRRVSNPEFSFQPDAVHPNASGHWFIARRLIGWFGDDAAANAETPEQMLVAKGLPAEVLPLIVQRTNVRRNAYLSAAGHQRPGVKAGLPIDEAEQDAQQLTEAIHELVSR